MLLEEGNKYLKTPITEDELRKVHTLYCLLDLTKEEFCNMIDAVGIDVLASGAETYQRLHIGETMLREQEQYNKAKEEILELDTQINNLKIMRRGKVNIIRAYEEKTSKNDWVEW